MIVLVIIMHAALATIFPIGRAVAPYVQPIFFTAVRMFVSGIILLMYQYFTNKKKGLKPFQCSKKLLFPLFMLAFFSIYLTNVFEFWALQFIPSAKASFIYSISPFCAAILSYFFFTETFTLKKFFGMAIGFMGFILMLLHDAPAEIHMGGIGFISWGELALLIAAISTAYGWIIMRKLIRTTHCTSIEANGISMVLGGFFALIPSFVFETWDPIPFTNGYLFLGYIILAILFSCLIGYTLYGILLKQYTSTFLSFAGFIEPLCAAIYGWIFLGEIVTGYFFLSVGIVFIGLYMFYIEELKQGYIVKSVAIPKK